MLLRNSVKIALLLILSCYYTLSAQYGAPESKEYTIAGISVTGNVFSDAETIISLSGLKAGAQLAYPNDPKVQEAINSLWRRKQFSQIDIVVDKVTPVGIFLLIRVKEFPRLNSIVVKNNNDIDAFDIQKAIGKVKGDIISPFDVYIAKKDVKKLYEDEGLTFAKVDISLEQSDSSNYTNMVVDVDEGFKYKVGTINFTGLKHFEPSDLIGTFDDTKIKHWWQIWRTGKFDPKKFQSDLDKLRDYFRKNGFIDAEIIKDTVIYNENTEKVAINIDVNEGEKFYVRDIDFEGNTVYPDAVLTRRLEFEKGDAYNEEKFQKNLNGNENQTDALSLYLDNGYLNTQFKPEIKRIGTDSIDILVNVYESERYKINKVEIVGNTKTKDKVIRRELYTRPGDYFDRSAIIRSIRALGMMNYFNQEALKPPEIKPVATDNTAVDLTYKVEERSTDTFNASVGFAGSFGLTLSLGLTFNNFAISEPLKGGGGQIFNMNIEFGQATRYRTFSLGLTEPWLFDEPTTLGFNIFDTYYNLSDISGIEQERAGFAANIGRRFRWPDDYWRGDWGLRVEFDNNAYASDYYRQGKYTEITLSQKFSRTSLNNLFFPTVGSKFSLSNDFAMGAIGIGETDYLKSELTYEMYSPLAQFNGQDRVVFMMSTKFGYITGFNSDTTISPIQLYRMGGNGLYGFGVTPLRGYPDNKIGTGNGDRVMAKYTAELRFALSLEPMPIYVYLFGEAGNVWSALKYADPFDVKRAAGVGIQLLVNPIGVIGFSYGYGFDTYTGSTEKSGWRFLFHIGQ